MENNFNNGDFEQFLRQNANQYRMYPSEKVWKGIHNNLHTRRRWYGLGLALLLFTAGTVTWIMMGSAGKNKPIADKEPAIITTFNADVPPVTIITPAPVKSVRNNKPVFSNNTGSHNLFIADRLTEPGSADETLTPLQAPAAINTNIPLALNTKSDKAENVPKPENPQLRMNTMQASRLRNAIASKHSINNTETLPVITDSPVPDEKEKIKETNRTEAIGTGTSFPLTIESVVNNYKYRKSRSKISLEFFVTPTVSYRKLSDNEIFLNAAARSNNNVVAQNYISVGDINSVVTHKPDLGLEIGFSAGLPVSRTVKLITGLQLNVSKYDIRAFGHAPEMATISLNTGGGAGNSVSAITNYRNLDVNNSNWLQNLYVSASLPVGAEWKVLRARNAYLGIGGTFQPTYILSDRVYLISTDYKNYAEVPSLIRRWNMNASFETFVGYTLGNMKWRIGPQVRYQLQSSFASKYPVKEHLFDYGLKLGLMLR